MPELLRAHLALAFRHADTAERIGKLCARTADQRGLFRRDITRERRLLDERRRGALSFNESCHREFI
jgi:hypothetical protein